MIVNKDRPVIVHRLDKEVSVIMVIAKRLEMYQHVIGEFKNRKIKKTYHAIVYGSVKSDRGIINKPIGRSPRDFRRRLDGRGARGELREAITRYRVVKRFTTPMFNLKFT